MGKKRLSIENRLILSLAKHGGTASLTQIRHDFCGRLTCAALDRTRPGLTGLVEAEKTRSKGSKRPTTNLSLTIRGWAAAQFLQPGWTPRRLTVDILREWLTELQAEREPWAMSLLKDGEDAREWRAHVAAQKKIRENKAYEARRRAEKPKAKHVQSAWFKEKVLGEPPEESNPEEAAIVAQTTPPAIPPPASHCRQCGHCERCHINSEFCQCGPFHVCGRSAPAYSPSTLRIEATSQGDADDSVYRAKIEAAGYGTAIRGANKIAYGGAIIAFEEFVRRMQL